MLRLLGSEIILFDVGVHMHQGKKSGHDETVQLAEKNCLKSEFLYLKSSLLFTA